MIRLLSAALALAVLLPSGGASAKELTVEELRAIQDKMKSSDHLAVDFVQSQFKALRSRTTKSEGKAHFSKPNKFRWAIEATGKELVFNGKEFFDYEPATKTATRYAPTGATSREISQIVDLVLNFDTLLARYDLVKATEDGDKVRIELKPKKDKEIVAVQLDYAKTDDYVSRVHMDLANQNKTTIDFAKPRRAAIPASTYALPAGVKITDTN